MMIKLLKRTVYAATPLIAATIIAAASAMPTHAADVNLAKGKKATQSSNAFTGGAGRAALAVDGNVVGDYAHGSVTHTKMENTPWWQVDLGKPYLVNEIKILNRTDCCAERLDKAMVIVADKPFSGVPFKKPVRADISIQSLTAAKRVNTVKFGRNARYVRVQLPHAEVLSMTEVQVMGTKALPPVNRTAERQIRAALAKIKQQVMKVPFFPKKTMNALFNGLKVGTTRKFGVHLEAQAGKFALTFFRVATYANAPTYTAALSYDGTLGIPDVGVWKHIPKAKLINPVIFFRYTGLATPEVPGSALKTLPGVLAKRAPKAVAQTATLRLPLGALVIAELEAKGMMKNILTLANYPTKDIFIMAGAGIDNMPPGGQQQIGLKNVDPIVASRHTATSIGHGNSKKQIDFVKLKSYLPSAAGYIKLSYKGTWKNPLNIFDSNTEAVDPVLMVSYGGDISTWGELRNVFGMGKKKKMVFAFDMPAVFAPTLNARAKQLSIGLSAKELTLNDMLKYTVAMQLNLMKDTFKKPYGSLFPYLPSPDAVLGKLFPTTQLDKVQKAFDYMYEGVDHLPLDGIKIVNPKFQAYNPKTNDYPPVETFSFFFAGGIGRLADGSFGPKAIINGDLEAFGLKLAGAKMEISLNRGIYMKMSQGNKLHLGKALGTSFDVKGKVEWEADISQRGALFSLKPELNILGVAKGEAELRLVADKHKQKMRVKFDPTGGCTPPVPIKIDTTIDLPSSPNMFKNALVDLVKGFKFDSGGITNCAGKVYEWGKTGIKYAGKGAVIAGEYVSKGAKVAGKHVTQGYKWTANEATKAYNVASAEFTAHVGGGAVKGGKAVINFANSVGGDIKDFSEKMVGTIGCEVFKDCKKTQRVASPFNCPKGWFYSLEMRQCWWAGHRMLAFAGAKTSKKLCLTIPGVGNGLNQPLILYPCGTKIPHLQAWQMGQKWGLSNPGRCLKRDANGFAVVANCGGHEKIEGNKLDKFGRLVVAGTNKKVCLRPEPAKVPYTLPSGDWPQWARLPGLAQDIGVGAGGQIYLVGGNDTTWYWDGGKKNWGRLERNLRRLDTNVNGDLWGVAANGDVMLRGYHAGGTWTKLPGKLTDVGVGSTRVAWGVGTNKLAGGYGIWRWDGKAWKQMPGASGVRIDAGPNDDAWIINDKGQVGHYIAAQNRWVGITALPGGAKATDIAVGGNGSVMVSTEGGKLYAFAGRRWVHFQGPGGNLSLDKFGRPWVAMGGDGAIGSIYATKKAVGGWAGHGKLKHSARVRDVGDATGARIKFVPCDDDPARPTWVEVAPSVNEDLWAKGDAVPRDFWMVGLTDKREPRCLDSHASGEGEVPWFWFCGNTPGKQAWQSLYVAPNKFAIYLPIRGLCLSDYRASGYEARLQKCDFSKRQLFSVQRSPHRDVWNKLNGQPRPRYHVRSGINNCIANKHWEYEEIEKGDDAYMWSRTCGDQRNGYLFSFWALDQKN